MHLGAARQRCSIWIPHRAEGSRWFELKKAPRCCRSTAIYRTAQLSPGNYRAHFSATVVTVNGNELLLELPVLSFLACCPPS
jgi:hypothetical protein